MTHASYGAKSRRPVHSGNRRVPGLFERTLASGATVYEASMRLSGSMRRHRLDAATKTDALRELREWQVDIERGYPRVGGGLTVSDLAADWIAHLTARVGHRDPRQRRSARTVDLYRQRLEQWIVPALGSRHVGDVALADVRRLVDRLNRAGLAPSSVSGVVGIASGLFRFAIKGGLIDRNPVCDLDRDDRPGVARLTEPRYLTAAEIDGLLANLGDTFRPVGATCAYAALRVSETLGLRWRDVDLLAGTMTVSGQLGADGERVPAKSAASAATVRLLPVLARELRE